jgi:hypothetical protein
LMAVYHELELMYTIIYCSTNAILQFCFWQRNIYCPPCTKETVYKYETVHVMF